MSAPASPSSSQPLARLQGTNHKSLIITNPKTILGRDPQQCDIALPSKSVSSKHAVLEYTEKNGQWHLTDLNSLNGTFVNHHRLSNEKLLLKHGDSLRFGYDQISYVLYILTDRDKKRPFEEPVLHQKTQLNEEQENKLQHEREGLRESIEEMKERKRREGDNGLGTLTFQGADGLITVPLGTEWDDDRNADEARDDFPVHESHVSPMRGMGDVHSQRHADNMSQHSSFVQQDTLHQSNLQHLESRLSTLEQLAGMDGGSPSLFNATGASQQGDAQFLEKVLTLTKEILETQSNNETGDDVDAQQPTKDNTAVEDNPAQDASLAQQQAILQNLRTIQQFVQSAQKENHMANAVLNDQEAGIKRYATAVYNELQRTKAVVHQQQSLIDSYKRDASNKTRATIETLTSQVALKNAEIAHLRDQLTKQASSMYSDSHSQQRIKDICTSQFEELELARKEIHEWRQRHRLRALEWESVMEERTRLEARVRELQHVLHRQMSEVHTLMMHKEQRLIEYKSRVTDLAAGVGTQSGTAEQQINRKKAADFLFDEITRCERENSNNQVQMKHIANQLHQSQLQNNELKLEINHLRDALQYTDAQHVQERVRALQDKLKDLQTECSVNKVLELQEDVVQLRERLQRSERRCKELQKTLSRVEVPIEDSCIAFLERKIKRLEESVQKSRGGKLPGGLSATAQKKAMERMNIQRLEKHNERLNRMLVEREYSNQSVNGGASTPNLPPRPPSSQQTRATSRNNRRATDSHSESSSVVSQRGLDVDANFLKDHEPPSPGTDDELRDEQDNEAIEDVSSIHDDDEKQNAGEDEEERLDEDAAEEQDEEDDEDDALEQQNQQQNTSQDEDGGEE